MAKLKENSKKRVGEFDDPAFFGRELLRWYDVHGRDLPWRIKKTSSTNCATGAPAAVHPDSFNSCDSFPDPYRVWLSEIMLQQTTVQAVIPYFKKFIASWPDIFSLAAAEEDELMQAWAGLGYYARARNLHKCAKIIASEKGGTFPADQAGLESLPGIGPYTGAAIAAIAFGRPANVVDGNVERVMSRLFALKRPLPAAKDKLRQRAAHLAGSATAARRPGDYAQALMDLGAVICTPKTPLCGRCPVAGFCRARARGLEKELPVQAPKKARPKKYGIYYWIVSSEGCVLFEKRPKKGLLGGMMGLPGSAWDEKTPPREALPAVLRQLGKSAGLQAEKLPAAAVVRHSFTHFDLELEGRLVRLEQRPKTFREDENLVWVAPADLSALGLPTLYAKAVRMVAQEF